MGMQIQAAQCIISPKSLAPQLFPSLPHLNKNKVLFRSTNVSSNGSVPLFGRRTPYKKSFASKVVVASAATWSPDQGAPTPSLSDILWPSLGAFAAMAILGKVDQMLAPKGLSMTVAPLGAVCAVLFLTPKSPGARKYNMFVAQIGCAAIGVLAFSVLGPGWLARSCALAASIAFMIYTRSTHPPAASLPLLFIDGAKMHHLNFWYSLFPGAAGCILLSLIQEIVCYLTDKYKF